MGGGEVEEEAKVDWFYGNKKHRNDFRALFI